MAEEPTGYAIARPTRQPVALQVFESALIVMVRSRMLSSVAMEICWAPSWSICS
jgi:hypothetical protein